MSGDPLAVVAPYGSRPAAGAAGGVLSGCYPSPGYGVGFGGFTLYDDFMGRITKGSIQTSLPWDEYEAGGGLTIVGATSTTTEIGVLRLAPTVTAGFPLASGQLYLADADFINGVPAGIMFGAKVRAYAVPSTLYPVFWAGWISDETISPLPGNTVNFVGIRARSNGTNIQWYGLVKDGAGLGNETTVDLGYAFDTTWRTLGFRVTTTGIQFMQFDLSGMPVYGWLGTDIGAEVTTNVPTGTLKPIAVGADNTTNLATGSIEIDLWSTAGSIAR